MGKQDDQSRAYDRYTIADYWLVIYRKRWVILLIVVVAAVVSGVVSKRLDPLYEARMVFFVPQDVADPRGEAVGGRVRPRVPSGVREHGQAYAAILEGELFMDAIHERHPDKPRGRFPVDVDIVVSRQGLIQVYVRDKNPQLAADIANEYLDYYNEYYAVLTQVDLESSLQRLMERREKYTAEIRTQFAQQARLREENRIASLDNKTQEMERAYARLQDSLEQASIGHSETGKRIAELEDRLALEQQAYVAGKVVLSDPLIASLRTTLAEIEVDIAGSKAELKENHPALVALEKRRASAKENLEKEIHRIVYGQAKLEDSLYEQLRIELVRLYVDQQALDARMTGLQETLKAHDKKMRSIPSVEVELQAIQENIRQFRSLIDSIENARDQLITQWLQMKHTGIPVTRASAPNRPVFPILTLNVLVAALAGLVVGILYAFFLDYLVASRRMRRLRGLERQEWAKALMERSDVADENGEG